MKSELTKQFVKKIIVKVIIFTFVMIIVTSITQSVSPVISNEMALTQMQNSNEMFVMMNTYNKIKPLIGAVYFGITALFTYTMVRDIYKFFNTIDENNNKEN